MKIRKSILSDARNISALSVQVWLDTYAINGIRSEISNYVFDELTPDKFERSLLDKNVLIFLAEIDSNTIGFVKLLLNSICPNDSNLEVEMDKLYVQRHFLRQGVGSQLLQIVEKESTVIANSGLWFSVWEKNQRAIEFYKQKDYTVIGTTYFSLESKKHKNLLFSKSRR